MAASFLRKERLAAWAKMPRHAAVIALPSSSPFVDLRCFVTLLLAKKGAVQHPTCGLDLLLQE